MALKFWNNWVAETTNDIIYGWRKVGEKMGIAQPIDSLFFNFESVAYDILFKQLYDYKWFNTEVIPKTGPCVVISNHCSLLDPLFIGLAIHKGTAGRQTWQLAKAELMRDSYLNIYTRMNHAIFIRRGDSDQQAIDKCKEKLHQGEMVTIFPEGTLGDGNGKFLDFKAGAIRIAHECDVPIIPAALFGTDLVFGKKSKVPATKGKVRAIFGTPIMPDKLVKQIEVSPGVMAPDYEKAMVKLQRTVRQLWADLWAAEQDTSKGDSSETK
jgi:1-acyl-sn-glycerol-3-phosphate acyltransferase